jgi:hypothetical protein
MVKIHIFIWFLSKSTPICDLDLGHRDLNFARNTLPHNAKHLCQVICNPCMHLQVLLQTSVFHWSRSVTLTFDLEIRFMHDKASLSGENFYEILFKFLHACKRYAQDKNLTPPTCLPEGKLWYKRAYKKLNRKLTFSLI